MAFEILIPKTLSNDDCLSAAPQRTTAAEIKV